MKEKLLNCEKSRAIKKRLQKVSFLCDFYTFTMTNEANDNLFERRRRNMKEVEIHAITSIQFFLKAKEKFYFYITLNDLIIK